MNAQDVVQQARNADLRLVRFLYCDNGGIIRGKATHASKLATRMSEGIGQTLAMQAFTGVESLDPVEGTLEQILLVHPHRLGKRRLRSR